MPKITLLEALFLLIAWALIYWLVPEAIWLIIPLAVLFAVCEALTPPAVKKKRLH